MSRFERTMVVIVLLDLIALSGCPHPRSSSGPLKSQRRGSRSSRRVGSLVYLAHSWSLFGGLALFTTSLSGLIWSRARAR